MCPKPATGGSGMSQAREGLTITSWSSMTVPCIICWGYLYLYQIKFTLDVHVLSASKHQTSQPVNYGSGIRYQDSRVSTLLFGDLMSVWRLWDAYVCIDLCVCVCPCVSVSGIYVEKIGKQSGQRPWVPRH